MPRTKDSRNLPPSEDFFEDMMDFGTDLSQMVPGMPLSQASRSKASAPASEEVFTDTEDEEVGDDENIKPEAISAVASEVSGGSQTGRGRRGRSRKGASKSFRGRGIKRSQRTPSPESTISLDSGSPGAQSRRTESPPPTKGKALPTQTPGKRRMGPKSKVARVESSDAESIQEQTSTKGEGAPEEAPAEESKVPSKKKTKTSVQRRWFDDFWQKMEGKHYKRPLRLKVPITAKNRGKLINMMEAYARLCRETVWLKSEVGRRKQRHEIVHKLGFETDSDPEDLESDDELVEKRDASAGLKNA